MMDVDICWHAYVDLFTNDDAFCMRATSSKKRCFSSVARGNIIGKSEKRDTEGIRPRGGAVLAVGLQRAR